MIEKTNIYKVVASRWTVALRDFTFGFVTEKALFQVILGLLGISIRSFLLVYAD